MMWQTICIGPGRLEVAMFGGTAEIDAIAFNRPIEHGARRTAADAAKREARFGCGP